MVTYWCLNVGQKASQQKYTETGVELPHSIWHSSAWQKYTEGEIRQTKARQQTHSLRRNQAGCRHTDPAGETEKPLDSERLSGNNLRRELSEIKKDNPHKEKR